MPARDKESYSIQSVENALDVLEALCEEDDDVRISRLSEKLKMNKTSVFRLLATFESRGYVERKKESGKYRLGLSAYEIGQKLLSRMTLLKHARPVMERFARDVDESVYIAVRRDHEVLFLDSVDTTQQVKIVSLVGKRFPLENTAPGRVILNHQKIADDKPAHSFPTPEPDNAVVETGGLGEGITCIAAPLYGTGHEMFGCLCLVGPDFRLTQNKIDADFLPKLKETANIISSKLGYYAPDFTRHPI